ncbi:hypothetical protein AALP_AA3G261500 [Arabis alpina]|uniref:Uncharacterized protein n=1 Tax=Arabis alpina TaxID=50452 RepID=A0A087HBR9_ARAAL|nr:hypothetical protein AALP_AA3G261500 [Arabis alpina]
MPCNTNSNLNHLLNFYSSNPRIETAAVMATTTPSYIYRT